MSTVYGPMNHYDYPVLNVECECYFCSEWRSKRAEFDRWKKLTKGHARTCYCWRCCNRRDAFISFNAISSKREVYCELSWYASHNTKYGPQLMSWLSNGLRKEGEDRDGWWSTRSVYYPLYHFLHQFQQAHLNVIPAVSGMFLEHLNAV